MVVAASTTSSREWICIAWRPRRPEPAHENVWLPKQDAPTSIYAAHWQVVSGLAEVSTQCFQDRIELVLRSRPRNVAEPAQTTDPADSYVQMSDGPAQSPPTTGKSDWRWALAYG